MAGSVNKVILIGNLGKDPEVKYLEGGIAVAKFPIATSETYKDRNTGEKKSTTEWHNIVLWRGLAEVAEKYLSKGKLVYIEGKLRTRTWEDQAGNKKYMTEVVGDNMTMLGGRRDEDPQSDTSAEAVSESSAADPAANKAVAENPIADKETSETTIAEENSTDDLPF